MGVVLLFGGSLSALTNSSSEGVAIHRHDDTLIQDFRVHLKFDDADSAKVDADDVNIPAKVLEVEEKLDKIAKDIAILDEKVAMVEADQAAKDLPEVVDDGAGGPGIINDKKLPVVRDTNGGRGHAVDADDGRGHAVDANDGRGRVGDTNDVRGHAVDANDGRGHAVDTDDGRGHVGDTNDGRGFVDRNLGVDNNVHVPQGVNYNQETPLQDSSRRGNSYQGNDIQDKNSNGAKQETDNYHDGRAAAYPVDPQPVQDTRDALLNVKKEVNDLRHALSNEDSNTNNAQSTSDQIARKG